MKGRFVAGFAITVLLIIVNQIIIQHALNLKRRDSSLINVAGRQRMLSQKIALEFHRLAAESPAGTEKLETYVNEWRLAHAKVLADSVEINRSMREDRSAPSAQWAADLSAGIQFVEHQLMSYRTSGRLMLREIDQNQESFLNLMEDIVGKLVDYSDSKLNKVIILEIILAAISVLIIFFEVKYLYYPQAKRLKDLLEVIRLKNKDLEEFTYITSHDLKEPLRTISNYLLVIEEDYSASLDPGVKVHLNTINRAADRMRKLIDSLLNFSKLGRQTAFASIDCDKMIREVLSDLSYQIETSQSQLVVTPLPVVAGNEIELRQVFQNLISNAIKFRKADTPARIEIGCTHKAASHEFYVSDNGIGIDPKHFDRIFQIFQRINKSQDFEGYGIGLANCRKIIEGHGGKIWVESEPGRGSVFKFSIQKRHL